MKPVSGERMGKLLEARGWVFARIKGSHHIDVLTGSPLRVPVPVDGDRDLRTGTQRAIMRQAGLTDADL